MKTPSTSAPGLARVAIFIWLLLGLALTGRAAGPAYYSVPNPDVVTSGEKLHASLVRPKDLRLTLSGTAPAGYRAGVLLASANSLLSASGLPSITIRTYLRPENGGPAQLQESQLVSLDVVQVALLGAGADRPTPLEFVSTLPFNQVEVELGPSLSLGYGVEAYYGYALPNNLQTAATGYLSRFTGSLTTRYSTAGTGANGLVCAATDVTAAANAVDTDLTNYATFSSLASVACPAALRVQLEGPSPAGNYAGFVLGSAGLLDAAALSGLRISTYRNGQLQETASGASLLELSVLPDDKAQVSFPTKLPFDEVKIERVGLLTALDNLNIYYGFGLEPQAFRANNPVLSNFPVTTGQYEVSYNGLLCALCSVSNPGAAADGNTSTTSYAQLNQPVSVLGNLSLKLHLNGHGVAGNRAGVVLQPGSGLLDVAALENIRINTYSADGKTLLESHSGASLLKLNLLPDGSQEVSFATTRGFDWVELEVAPGVASLSNARVYYAFADDKPVVLPLTVTPPAPLPVELSAFSGRWENAKAVLRWETASERTSSHFVVERALASLPGEKAPALRFLPLGTVAAAGNSGSRRTYAFTDPEPATAATTRYYRLRQVDTDGAEKLSVSVVLQPLASRSVSLSLYPNPAVADVALALGTPAVAGQQVRVYSALGQLVHQQPALQERLRVASWPAGLYQVVLVDAAGVPQATQRLVLEAR